MKSLFYCGRNEKKQTGAEIIALINRPVFFIGADRWEADRLV
jgi:hypothetical protein